MNKRWYDADPVITNALNLIQNANLEKKNSMADFIIKEAAKVGVVIEQSKFDCFWHKRQDESSNFFMAIECLKAMEYEDKKELALKIISAFNKNMHQI